MSQSEARMKANAALLAATQYTERLSEQRRQIREAYGLTDEATEVRYSYNECDEETMIPVSFYDAYSSVRFN